MNSIKKWSLLCALVLASVGSVVAQARFLTWTSYPKDGKLDAYFQEMKDVGLDGIIVNATPEQVKEMVPYAEKYKMELHVWYKTLCDGDIAAKHPDWLDYNRLGQSMQFKKAYVDYYKFLNPIIPGVQKAVLAKIAKYAAIPGVKSISLDYCRYVDAILPTTLWKNYDVVQDKVYPEWDYGYHPMMLKAFEEAYNYDPRNQPDVNADKVWHQFRMDAVNNLVFQIAELVKGAGKELTASPFPTPKMSARMVYQDWAKWPLDRSYPMIYNGFYDEHIEWIGQCVADCMEQAHEGTDIYVGLYTDDFKKGTGDTFTDAVEAAVKNGAKGFSLFTFGAMNKAQRKELKRVIQSMK